MLVNRITIVSKVGHRGDLQAVLKEWVEWINHPHPVRIYTPNIAPGNAVVIETEFESLAEMESTFAEWFANPEYLEFNRKFEELRDGSITQEVWNLLE